MTDPASSSRTEAAVRAHIRTDLRVVADMVEPNSRVLDVGAGDGALLDYLVHFKHVDGRGIELGQQGVSTCVSHGLSVIQGNAETDLKDYPPGAFDYVVLSQTLPAMHDVRGLIEQMLRIGKRAVVSFPNFGHWRVRWSLVLTGRTPMTPALPHLWYETPNIRLCTIGDFFALCADMGIQVQKSVALSSTGHTRDLASYGWWGNLMAQEAIFLLGRE